jgi:hypothetical protein
VEYWLGYLAYLVVDCDSELPIAFDLRPANDSETKRLVPIFEDLRRDHPQLAGRIAAVMADRGYDSGANCRYVYDQLEALPIIKMRLPARPDRPCAAAKYLCNGYGTPLCASGYRLAYWGRDGDYLKWRCPVAAGQADECRYFGRCSSSEYGAVWKMDVHKDLRRIPGLGRETNKFGRLYDKRSAVERVNGRLKEYLLADDVTIRTLPKVKMHLNLALVVMLAGAWAMVSRQKLQRARQIVRLAA